MSEDYTRPRLLFPVEEWIDHELTVPCRKHSLIVHSLFYIKKQPLSLSFCSLAGMLG